MDNQVELHQNKKTNWFQDALCVNRDPSWNFLFDNGSIRDRESAIRAAEEYFLKFTGYCITDFFICLFEEPYGKVGQFCGCRGNVNIFHLSV